MTFEHATMRLLLASVVCGVITNLPLGLLAALAGNLLLAGIFIFMIPLAVLVYAMGLAIFGVPLLFLWPSAFKRGVARGLAATATGAATVAAGMMVRSFDVRSLPKLRFDIGDLGSVLFLALCGAIAGFVWWWLNFEVAPSDDDLT